MLGPRPIIRVGKGIECEGGSLFRGELLVEEEHCTMSGRFMGLLGAVSLSLTKFTRDSAEAQYEQEECEHVDSEM